MEASGQRGRVKRTVQQLLRRVGEDERRAERGRAAIGLHGALRNLERVYREQGLASPLGSVSKAWKRAVCEGARCEAEEGEGQGTSRG